LLFPDETIQPRRLAHVELENGQAVGNS